MDQDDLALKEILDQLYDGIYVVDPDRRITYWNRQAAEITGFSADEIVGHHCYNNILNHVDEDGNHLCHKGCPLYKTIGDGKPREAKVFLHHKNGHRVAVSVRTIPFVVSGKSKGAIEVFTTDTRKSDIEKTVRDLEKLALYDQLTELPNRRYIESYLSGKFRMYHDLDIPFALAMMDIDHFKKVNDTYGHQIGDLILQMVARTFTNAISENDFIGRWGGEEFLAVLSAAELQELAAVLNKIRILTESSVLRCDDKEINVTISIGGSAILPSDEPQNILKRADEALYQSKSTGRNRVTIL